MKHGENKKIAAWAGLRPSFLSQIFNGKKRPSPKKAAELEKATGVALREWLLVPHDKLKRKVIVAYRVHIDNNSAK